MLALRSLLFVPATRPDRFANALGTGSDAACLDLEDSVAAERKDEAREQMRAYFHCCGDALRTVRINAPDSEEGRRDLRALADADLKPGALLIPKADSSDVAVQAVRFLGEGVPVVALIESVAGLRAADAIARVPGVAMLMFGSADYAAEVGCSMSETALASPRAHIAQAAGAAGIACMDGAWLQLDDPDGLVRECAVARDLGFSGKPALHPRQVAKINKAFTPAPSVVEHARAIVSAAAAAGAGVAVLDGAMIDGPVARAAERVLALARGGNMTDDGARAR